MLLPLFLLLAGCVPASAALPTAHPSPSPTQDPTATPTPRRAEPSPTPEGIRILALGDSYTIGESVPAGERWPIKLAAILRQQGFLVAEPQIIARTGWTTGDLDASITMENPAGPFDLVTLLIGVNNQYRGYPIEDYAPQFRALLERSIALAGGRAERVIVVSIPDWGVTPFAEGRSRALIAEEIDAYNQINRAEAETAGARYIDVTPISREASSDISLIAYDGLHPSGAMYARWVELILPAAQEALAQP